MQTLRMLGEIGLAASDGAEVDALLRQPKSVALLAYLAMPRPGTWHRRDLLLAALWSGLSQSGGRTALRSALHMLRRHLDEGTIRTRGDDEVGVDPDRLGTDVAAMLDDVATGDHARALARYGGELLPGLFISDAREFEQWLDGERARLKSLAGKAAVSLADARERAGDVVGAVDAARRACELDPDDEPATRRWISLLDRTGDRTQAHAVYEQFRSRAAAEFGAEPSPQTRALMQEMRSRPTPASPALDPPASAPPAMDAERAAVPTADEPSATTPGSTAAPRRAARREWRAAAVIATIAAVSLIALARRPSRSEGVVTRHADASAVTPVAGRHVVLLPIVDETGDSTQRYLATGIAYGITRRLERLGTLTIRSGAPAEWAGSADRGLKTDGALGATVLLRLTLAREADSLRVRATLRDSATGDERQIVARRFGRDDLRDLESHVAAAVAGSLFRVGAPIAPAPGAPSVHPESYRLTVLGYHQSIALRDQNAALQSFMRATEIDPSNARAWAGVSTVWGVRTLNSRVPLDVGFERTSAAASRALAIDSGQGSALANLGVVRILRYRTLSAGMPLVRRAMAAEPSNPEVFFIASFLVRHAHAWDEARDLARVARQLDPLTEHFTESEATVELCAGRPAEGERLYRQLLAVHPGNASGGVGLVRALAQQGRFDEALAQWRVNTRTSAPPGLATALARARGREGYVAARRLEARLLLADTTRGPDNRTGGLLRLLQLQFQSGDTAAGFANLTAAVADSEAWLYRLPCMAPLDEVRDLPRFRSILAAIGTMPQR